MVGRGITRGLYLKTNGVIWPARNCLPCLNGIDWRASERHLDNESAMSVCRRDDGHVLTIGITIIVFVAMHHHDYRH